MVYLFNLQINMKTLFKALPTLVGRAIFFCAIGMCNHARANEREINCLTAAIFYEARGEITQGQEAVAQVILNRAAIKTYPPSVCKVISQPWQFSWYNNSKAVLRRLNGRISDLNLNDRVAYQQAKEIAIKAYTGLTEPNPKLVNSLYFVHKSVTSKQQPWLTKLKLKARIGNHKFY